MAQSSDRIGDAGSSSDMIERFEQPPDSDAAWAEALRYYGNDRKQGHAGLDSCLPAPSRPPSGVAAKRSQLLIHHEIDDDEEDNDTQDNDPQDATNPTTTRKDEWRNRQYGFGSWGGDVHVLTGTAADTPIEKVNNRTTSPTPLSAQREATSPSDYASAYWKRNRVNSLAFTQLSPHASLGAFDHQYVESASLPRSINPAEDGNHLCQESERVRLRAFYDKEGWLPAPNPSRNTRLRRSRAIRRLGLNDADDDEDRFAVISRFLELAQLTFGTDGAAVAVMRGDTEDVYHAGSSKSRHSFPVADSLSGHVVLNPEGRCFVVADMDKDWRFKTNPHRIHSFFHEKFIAAAPLRYHRSSGDFVDFGTLCLVGFEPRNTFGQRDQGILLRLANMLVYQLATLQSEIVAKRSSHMYESSINFLRRSLIPEHMKTGAEAAVVAEKKEKEKMPASPKEKRKKRNKSRLQPEDIPRPAAPRPLSPSASASVPLASGVSAASTPQRTPSESPRPPLIRATKSGPRDSQRAKRKDLRAENSMFNDAANTLRGILRADGVCMVDLHEYQLYIRKGGPRKDDKPEQTKEMIVSDFLQGKDWPKNIEPVVKHVPRAEVSNIEIMGHSGTPGSLFNFNQPGAIATLTEFLKEYFTARHFWWDREDKEDDLAQRVMCFSPDTSQTLLVSVFLTHNGTLRHATFVSWERPPANFDDSSRLALPFVWIIAAALVSALAVTRVRNVEESQITYSNLQAHELRTPLHQILAITQLLRSSMSDLAEGASLQTDSRGGLTTLEQVRDLLPFLDAIDTSGKTLHGIVDNILTFLDLTASDNKWESARAKHPIFGQRSSVTHTFGSMMEELVQDAYEEHRRSHIGGQSVGHIETVFEFIPKGLSDLLTDDSGGALRRALGRLINNAYRFIDGPGCVEIYIDYVKSMLPPAGYEDLSNSRRIAIHIIDNGRGMAHDFVEHKLGEPWAKEDLYATGSGLSVHLAFRIIDLMGGHMKISSAPGQGTVVTIEVPVPCQPQVSPPESPVMPRRKIALLGFKGCDERCGLERLGASLERQYNTLGCDKVSPEDAELVIVNGGYEDDPEAALVFQSLTATNVVIFENDDASATPSPATLGLQLPPGTRIRRLRKPVTPAMVLATLEEAPTPVLEAQELDSMGRIVLRPRFEPEPQPEEKPSQGIMANLMSGWKAPRGVCVEEAVASLCLGDYFSSRTRATRLPSSASSGTSIPTSPLDDRVSSEAPSTPNLASTPTTTATTATTPSDDPVTVDPYSDSIKVLVVEDNVINRKILVKIISTLGGGPVLDIIEAGDGQEAVEHFRTFDAPAIVLLDINMPRMDGYAAAVEMRLIEKRKKGEIGLGVALDGVSGYNTPNPKNRSKIFAVTALAGEDEKRRGLVESGMDMWLTKPCPKATLQAAVEDARREIVAVRFG